MCGCSNCFATAGPSHEHFWGGDTLLNEVPPSTIWYAWCAGEGYELVTGRTCFTMLLGSRPWHTPLALLADPCWYLFFIKHFKPWVRRISGQYSSLQAALSVLVIYYMGELLLGGVLLFVHYNGKCWYFLLQVGNFELVYHHIYFIYLLLL